MGPVPVQMWPGSCHMYRPVQMLCSRPFKEAQAQAWACLQESVALEQLIVKNLRVSPDLTMPAREPRSQPTHPPTRECARAHPSPKHFRVLRHRWGTGF